MDGTMAVVTTWAADFAPKNWAFCNGQILPISQNAALYSLLGVTYGGDGRVTFGLPDMRGRTAINTGMGAGLSNYLLGQIGGSPTTSLTTSNIPTHTHSGAANFSLQGNATEGTTGEPGGNFPGNVANGYNTSDDTTAAVPNYTAVVGISGSGMPYDMQAPYLVVNYIICMYGIYPSRN